MNSCLDNCFRYAKSINKVKYNPVEGIVYPKNHDVVEDKENYISEDDQKHLLEALEFNEFQGITLLGLMRRVRLRKATALQTNDMDFNRMNIKINKSVKYVWTGERNKENKKIYENKVTIPNTKTSIREVPLPVMLKPIIKTLIKKNMENKLKLGELYFDNNLIFCKTNCLSKDINPRTVMDLVGHTDIKMTMLVYAEFYVFPTIFVTFNFQIYIIVTLNLGLISFQVSKTLYFPR